MKPFPIWYIKAINEVAKQFREPVEYDKELATWRIGSVTLTAPGGEGNEDSRIDWVVGLETIIPGVRYMRNGDPGWPDEVDWEQDSVHIFPNALKRVAEILATNIVDGVLEGCEMESYEDEYNFQRAYEGGE